MSEPWNLPTLVTTRGGVVHIADCRRLRPLAEVDRTWRPNNRTPLEERLWRRVGIDDAGCWIWTGGADRAGYGRLRAADGKQEYVHRVSYQLLVGPIPDGLQLDHLCRVTPCVNPDHLEPVTARENILRSESFQAKNARKTHCPKGHPYSGANLAVRTSGTHSGGNRVCMTCSRERQRAAWKKNHPVPVEPLVTTYRGFVHRESCYRVPENAWPWRPADDGPGVARPCGSCLPYGLPEETP